MLRAIGARPVATDAPAAILINSRRESDLGMVVFSEEHKQLYATGHHIGSFMACQAVAQPGNQTFFLLHMAIQTPAHVHLYYRSGDRHLTNITMAGLTIFAYSQMSLMTEVNKFRLVGHAHPWDRLAALPVAGQALDITIVGFNGGMAAHTFLHGRYSGNIRAQRAGMAEQTLQTGLHVGLVVIGDGLLWGSPHPGLR